MGIQFNDRLRQILLLAIIIIIAFLLISEMYIFLPGLLGGVTLYILFRALFFRLTFVKKWKKGWTALLFILICLVVISIPVYVSIKLVSPKINSMIGNQEKIFADLRGFSTRVSDYTGVELLTEENTKSITQKVSGFIPTLLNSTAGLLTNLLMMFFLFYYLLVSGREVEKYLHKIIPLKNKNIDILASETKLMIRANALGIPIICIVQGATAALGYWIFGVKDWAMWGFVTGVFAFFPLVGTMIIWIPIVISLYSTNATWMATGLMIYSIVVTGNVDYIARLGLLKKMGNVHPMITVLGVIVGLGLFGFMGLIFGPLLVSYFIILVKIYLNEFTSIEDENEAHTKE
ncbi:MAG: AI-2E family transporter [Ferruginibacter sp.]